MNDDTRPAGVRAIADSVRRRDTSPEAWVTRALDAIGCGEPDLKAWAFVAPDDALLSVADSVDVNGPLAGVPVGIKDVIDVAGMPTRCGAQVTQDRPAQFDACCVGLLRAAGAIPVGKTVTAEYAYKHPGPTTNPHDPRRTPGGSSSGSAAAVAAGMVPAAIGTQTGGSMIRPAAFCGITGFKPSYGAVFRDGMKLTCESLDVIGWYGTTVDDVTALAEVLLPEDVSCRAPVRAPRVAVVSSYPHVGLDDDARAVLEQVERRITAHGAQCFQVPLQRELPLLADAHRIIMQYEFARSLAPVARLAGSALSESLRECVTQGLAIPRAQYRDMKEVQHASRHAWASLVGDADLILTPSTPGEAPLGLAETGSSAFNVVWSVLGWPCLHIPAGASRNRMPLGVQLVADWRRDVALLEWGAWVEAALSSTMPGAAGT
jgi:Asp-tRNA(Asn)/Glu-tRNA(Gln) amidotransferase A subunit family amidase